MLSVSRQVLTKHMITQKVGSIQIRGTHWLVVYNESLGISKTAHYSLARPTSTQIAFTQRIWHTEGRLKLISINVECLIKSSQHRWRPCL